MDQPLTLQEAAELLGYHPDHLRRLLKSGQVRAGRFHRAWAIPRQEVERVKALQGKGGRLPRSPGKAEP